MDNTSFQIANQIRLLKKKSSLKVTRVIELLQVDISVARFYNLISGIVLDRDNILPKILKIYIDNCQEILDCELEMVDGFVKRTKELSNLINDSKSFLNK